MCGQVFGERGDGLGIPALGGEQHPGLIDIDKQRDVVVAAPGRRLIDGDPGHIGGVVPRPRLVDIVVQHTPQPCVVFTHHPGHGPDRHGRNQGHEQRLEQQGEAAVGSCPGHVGLPDAARVAADPRYASVQISLMLEEVEMAPRHLLGVVGGAVRGATVRTGEAAARREVDVDVEPVCLGVEVAAGYRPRRRQAQCQLQQVRIAHPCASAVAARPV